MIDLSFPWLCLASNHIGDTCHHRPPREAPKVKGARRRGAAPFAHYHKSLPRPASTSRCQAPPPGTSSRYFPMLFPLPLVLEKLNLDSPEFPTVLAKKSKVGVGPMKLVPITASGLACAIVAEVLGNPAGVHEGRKAQQKQPMVALLFLHVPGAQASYAMKKT